MKQQHGEIYSDTKALRHFESQQSSASLWSAISWSTEVVQHLNHINAQSILGRETVDKAQ